MAAQDRVILTCLPALAGQSNSIIAAEIPSSYSCPPRLHTLDITVKRGVDILFAWFLSLATLSEDLDDALSAHALVAYSQRFGAELEFLSIWLIRESLDGAYLHLLRRSHKSLSPIQNTKVRPDTTPSQPALPAHLDRTSPPLRPVLVTHHPRNRWTSGWPKVG
ncbi:hypothetical protein B0H13DRAFT_1960107 [Mycena leptocephala]|nr:hypothetical protein B0H13DRAFT_1960107 [Mycena leptocephala]